MKKIENKENFVVLKSTFYFKGEEVNEMMFRFHADVMMINDRFRGYNAKD